MNHKTYQELQNQKIFLFGKSRAFDKEEFAYQIQECHSTLVENYEDEVSFIVEGRLITPYEQNEFDRLYEAGLKEKFISIDAFEKLLIQNIDEDSLLMSLKLSHDKARVLAYLKNSQINDTLFLKLMKLYDWQNEGFFDNDENRYVTAALISRFYKNIERNHNVQYATLGLMHLVQQSNNSDLIEVIAALEPLKKGVSNQSLYAIMISIAKNKNTPDTVLKMLVKNGNLEIRDIIASRENLDKNLQNMLLSLSDATLNETLCKNENIDVAIAQKLQESYPETLAEHMRVDNAFFELWKQKSPSFLAKNKTLTCKMQERLLELNDRDVTTALSTNSNLYSDVIDAIFLLKDDAINLSLLANPAVKEEHLRQAYEEQNYHLSLAQNCSTPVDILEKLGASKELEVLKALCSNSSTPVSLLYELRLDQRLDRLVSENESFGEYIKTENIGWQI
jgi:hypothetical protein